MSFNIAIPLQAGSSYSYSEFSAFGITSLYVVLEDAGNSTSLPLVAFSSNFALNEIPQATCTVSIGRDTSSNGAETLAPIHTSFTLRTLQSAKVYFHPRGNSSKDTPWPDKEFLIFEGYVTAVRRSKSFGKYQIELSLTHWLFDLSCSSAVSGSSHVANPADLTETSVYDLGTNGSGNTANVLGASIAGRVSAAISVDLWGCLKSIFTAYATDIPIGIFSECLSEVIGRNNARAIKALKKIEGPDFNELNKTGKDYEFGNALELDFMDVASYVLDAIESAIVNEQIRSYAETSLWTKLISQFCPLFGLAVVPMIESAIVIADTPIYTSPEEKPYKTIKAEDYDSEITAGTMERPIAGVIVTSSPTSPTNSAKVDGLTNVVGCYVADATNTDGVVLSTSTPPWLNFIPREQGTFPEATQSNREIFNKWAKEIYVKNSLRGRTQTLNGRLRFDIAPGSIVRISGSRESPPVSLASLLPTLFDKIPYDTFGQVIRVSTYINIEAPAAGTSFLIGNVRTANEYAGSSSKFAYNVSSPAIFTQESIHGNGLHGSPLSSAFK